jgi:hypothetical protein
MAISTGGDKAGVGGGAGGTSSSGVASGGPGTGLWVAIVLGGLVVVGAVVFYFVR